MRQQLVKILLIEDDPDDILLIKKMLSEPSSEILELNLKFKLECAESIQKGMEILEKGKFDLILLDLGLPDSQGLATVNKIYSKASKVPIIVLTDLSDGPRGIKALHRGAQDYLVKSRVDSNLLVRSICYAIKRQQMQEEAERIREEFVAILTHDLKTPLISIMGFTSLLAEPETGEIPREKLEYIQNIKHSGKILFTIINNIVEASKIEAGQMKIISDFFLLDKLLEELHNTFKPLAIKEKINLDFSCPDKTEVYADQGKIREVFHNLIGNALRYTPKGGTISITASPEGERIAIQVADTGCGIPESDQKKLFQKFVQVKNKHQKTGLGLYIVKNFLKGHGSDIRVESAVNKGTCFFFSLAKGKK